MMTAGSTSKSWRINLQEGVDINKVPVWELGNVEFSHGCHPQAAMLGMSNFLYSGNIPLLLEHIMQPGVMVNAEVPSGYCQDLTFLPLVEAVNDGYCLPLFVFLLNHPGIDVNRIDKVNGPVLHRACEKANLPAIQRLLRRSDLEVNLMYTPYGTTALAKACRHERLDVIQLLLQDPRVDLNAIIADCTNPKSTCALFVAVKAGHEATVRLLLDHGRQTSVHQHFMVDAWQEAVRKGNGWGMAQLLSSNFNVRDKYKFYGESAALKIYLFMCSLGVIAVVVIKLL